MDKVIVYRSRSEMEMDNFLWDNTDILVPFFGYFILWIIFFIGLSYLFILIKSKVKRVKTGSYQRFVFAYNQRFSFSHLTTMETFLVGFSAAILSKFVGPLVNKIIMMV